jgi:hypothetical protein
MLTLAFCVLFVFNYYFKPKIQRSLQSVTWVPVVIGSRLPLPRLPFFKGRSGFAGSNQLYVPLVLTPLVGFLQRDHSDNNCDKHKRGKTEHNEYTYGVTKHPHLRLHYECGC